MTSLAKRFTRHGQRLWGRFWPLVLLPLPVLAGLAMLGLARPEHYVALGLIPVFALATRWSRDLLVASAPGIAIGVGYEAIRLVRPLFVTPERVFACEFADLDAALFGLGSGRAPADFFAAFHATPADLLLALPYTFFWVAVIVYAIVLFALSRNLLHRFLWLLALTHLVGFVLWMAMPTAPPWYVRLNGCAIDIAALPGSGALARVDALFSMHYFQDFYSRAPTVFGAFPSLHVSFPAAVMVSGWCAFGRVGRGVTLGLTLWMLLASVYLDHHWLLDGLATLVIVVVVHRALTYVWPGYRSCGAALAGKNIIR